MLKGLNLNQDGVSYHIDKKTGKKLPVLIKKCRGMDGAIKAQTMMPTIILEKHKQAQLDRKGKPTPGAMTSTWGGTVREPIRTALKVLDNQQRRVIRRFPRK